MRASAVKSKSGESLCTRAAKVKREWHEQRRLATKEGRSNCRQTNVIVRCKVAKLAVCWFEFSIGYDS